MNHADGYDADAGLSMTISFAPERGDGVGGWKSVMGAAACPLLHGRMIGVETSGGFKMRLSVVYYTVT